jgi:hypothetical protein
MTKTIYLFESLMVIFILSCSNTSVEYDKPTSSGKLLVETYIKEGDTAIMVRLEKPISVYTWNENNSDTTHKIHNAIVKVFIDGNEYLLNENPSPQFNWYGVSMCNSSLYSLRQEVTEFSDCSIIIDYEGKRYDASAINPGKVKALSAEAKFSCENKTKYFSLPLDVKCSLDYDKDKNNYYRVNATAYIKYNGKEGWINYYYSYFVFTENTKNVFDLTLNWCGGNFNSYDLEESENISITKVVIYVEKISEEYYHLREALNAQHTDYDTPFGSEVTEIPSNINNGYGIFTCISRDSICANIIK